MIYCPTSQESIKGQRISSMALEQEECGRKAFDLLYNNMTQGTVGYYKNMLHLVERESTGKCRETEKI